MCVLPEWRCGCRPAYLLFQQHYGPTGQPETDRTRIGPPQAPAHEVRSCYKFERAVDAVSFTAHMHYRGRAMTAEATYSAGNPLNPDPSQTVRWGEPSDTEMMGLWVEYIDR